MNEQAAAKGVNEEQTASLETALLHGPIGLACGPRCEPLSGAPFQSRGHRRFEPPRVWSMPAAGLTCHCVFWLVACCVMDSLISQAVAADGADAPGLTLTCRASNASPLVITAHRMRAFLLASATAAFCQPTRSLSAAAHLEMESLGSSLNTVRLKPNLRVYPSHFPVTLHRYRGRFKSMKSSAWCPKRTVLGQVLPLASCALPADLRHMTPNPNLDLQPDHAAQEGLRVSTRVWVRSQCQQAAAANALEPRIEQSTTTIT